MALLQKSLRVQGSVVRIRATAADGVKIRTLLSSSGPPLRLKIVDKREDEKEEEVSLLAIIQGGTDEDPAFVPAKKARLSRELSSVPETSMVSRSVSLLLQPGGVASLRLDLLLSELIGEGANSSEINPVSEAHAKLISLPVFRVSIHIAASRTNTTNRIFPLPTAIIRAEGIDFPFTRELLCLQSEFFCALLYGSFAESGKDLVELETFTAEEIGFLYESIQRGVPVNAENAMTALAVADRVLSSSLTAQVVALPIPKNQEEKEEWIIGADKYNSMELANRMVLSISQREAAEVHLKLFDKISNKEVPRLLLLRATGRIGTFIAMDMADFGTVRIRLFADEHPEATEKLLKLLPLSTTWLNTNNPHFYFSVMSVEVRPKSFRRGAGWTLCVLKSDRSTIPFLWNNVPHANFISLGEVVDGVKILEGPMKGRDTLCTIRVSKF